MRRLLVGGIVLLGLAANPLAARASVVVQGSTSGTWENPVLDTLGTTTGAGTDTFTWGTGFPDAIADRSVLHFVSEAFDTLSDTPFKLGAIEYYNGTILQFTGALAVDLDLLMSFVQPPAGDFPLTLTFNLINTDNIDGDADASADIVHLPVLPEIVLFDIGSTQYVMEITGFQSVVGDGFLTSDDTKFHVREGQTASAELWGILRVVEETPGIPEPGSLALCATGLALLGYRQRRRRQRP